MGLSIPNEVLVLAAMILLLSGVLRRFFGSQTAGGRIERKLAKARDYGLLSEVATAPSEQAAAFVGNCCAATASVPRPHRTTTARRSTSWSSRPTHALRRKCCYRATSRVSLLSCGLRGWDAVVRQVVPLPDKDGCRALAEKAAGQVGRAGS